MIRTDNDILAEYVRKTRPEIEQSLDFMLYRFKARISDAVNNAARSLSRMMNSSEMMRATAELGRLKSTMTEEEWEAYINAADEEEPAGISEQLESDEEDEAGYGRCFGASFGDCEECRKNEEEEDDGRVQQVSEQDAE